MSTTPGTIKHRHQSAVVPTPGADVSKNEWNDSLVAAGTVSDGASLVRDSAQADGWGWGPKPGGTTDVAASRPTAGTRPGELFLPSDGFTLSRDSGSAYVPFGPVFPFTVPTDPGTWMNQGSSTLTVTKDALQFVFDGAGSGANLVARVGAKAAPYTYTAFFLPMMISKQWSAYGLCWTDGTKLVAFGVSGSQASSGAGAAAGVAAVTTIRIMKYSTTTSYSADYTPSGYSSNVGLAIGTLPNWMRIRDDNASRYCDISADGQNWMNLHSVTRTDFLTPTSVGVFASRENSVAPNLGVLATLLHLG